MQTFFFVAFVCVYYSLPWRYSMDDTLESLESCDWLCIGYAVFMSISITWLNVYSFFFWQQLILWMWFFSRFCGKFWPWERETEGQWREVQIIPLVSSFQIHSVLTDRGWQHYTTFWSCIRRCEKHRIMFLNYRWFDIDIVNFFWLCWRYQSAFQYAVFPEKVESLLSH